MVLEWLRPGDVWSVPVWRCSWVLQSIGCSCSRIAVKGTFEVCLCCVLMFRNPIVGDNQRMASAMLLFGEIVCNFPLSIFLLRFLLKRLEKVLVLLKDEGNITKRCHLNQIARERDTKSKRYHGKELWRERDGDREGERERERERDVKRNRCKGQRCQVKEMSRERDANWKNQEEEMPREGMS